MRSIWQWLGLEPEASRAAQSDSDTVRRIAAELDRLPPEEARYLAAFAYVLARVANADLDISRDELRVMEEIVRDAGALSEAQAVLVTQIAKTQAIGLGATEDYLVTRQFRELSDRAQRIGLIRCLFAVAAADGRISQVEDQGISQIGSELGLTAPEITSCRVAFRDHLAVLQDLPRGAADSAETTPASTEEGSPGEGAQPEPEDS